MNSENNSGNGFMLKICAFIVDKRNLFFLIYAILAIFAVITKGWVAVENDLAFYLPSDCETRQGLDLMEEQFTTYGSVNVMVANISYEEAMSIQDDIESIDGVFSVAFDDTDEHYANGSALFSITFDYDEESKRCLSLLDEVRSYFAPYDAYITTTLGDIQSELIDQEMQVISVIVVIIVVLVLILTSQAYAEVPVLLITFGSAALVQMGSNFLLGTISFVSDSVTVVLQLALSVDYAIIFLNRYKEEHAVLPSRESTIIALSKAIPEIGGSSMTTIGGLFAMMFMKYQMGADLGVVLIKAILLSLLSVFLLMPGVIMIFSKAMENTQHKNFIPEIPFVGRFAYRTRFFIAPAYAVIIIAASVISSHTPYVYGDSKITPPIINDVKRAENMQDETFTTYNPVALVVPGTNYDSLEKLVRDLEKNENVHSVTSLANQKAINDYTLTNKLSPRQFSELLDLDYEVAELVYAAYAVNDEDYAKAINGLANYRVPLIDMFMFIYNEVNEGYVTLDDDVMEDLTDANRLMTFAKDQLEGEKYSRMILYLNLPEESDETFAFIDELHNIAGRYYNANKVYVVGESVSQYDLQKCFSRDNRVVSIVSIIIVLIVLLFTFKSAGMPVLLIAVIQGCIWINFSFPALQHDNLFFLSYLIVSSIQMGANIDYAIVISSRYTELRGSMNKRDAIINTMNLSFPTIITSGTMLAVAGTLIGSMTSDCAIYGIGKCIGRGTIISICVTMFVLPQILLVGDKIIELTAFVMNMPLSTRQFSGSMRIDGMVRGQINGTVTGVMHAIVRGDISAFVDNKDVTVLSDAENASVDGGDNATAEKTVSENDAKTENVPADTGADTTTKNADVGADATTVKTSTVAETDAITENVVADADASDDSDNTASKKEDM